MQLQNKKLKAPKFLERLHKTVNLLSLRIHFLGNEIPSFCNLHTRSTQADEKFLSLYITLGLNFPCYFCDQKEY